MTGGTAAGVAASAALPAGVVGGGRQDAPPAPGRPAKAELTISVVLSVTVLPTPVRSWGRLKNQVATVTATTIQMTASAVVVARLRSRPYQASQIAAMITIGRKNGQYIASARLVTMSSTTFLMGSSGPSVAAASYVVMVSRSTALAHEKIALAQALPMTAATSEQPSS